MGRETLLIWKKNLLYFGSMGTENHTRITENSTVYFYNVGIGEKDADEGGNPYHPKWMLRRFSTLYKALDPPVNDEQVKLENICKK